MNEMIERAARAACRQVEQSLATKDDPKPWTALGHATLDSWVDAYWRNYVPEVRAVIEAMQPELRAAYELGMADANKAHEAVDGVLK